MTRKANPPEAVEKWCGLQKQRNNISAYKIDTKPFGGGNRIGRDVSQRVGLRVIYV